MMDKSEKRFLFLINTAGQAYTWLPLYRDFLRKGYPIKILARNQGHTIEVLQAHGVPCHVFDSIGSQYTRLLGAFSHLQKVFNLSKDFNASIFIGFGIDAAITATRLGKRCILFIDDDPTTIQNRLSVFLSDAVITPQCFKANFGRKHFRVAGYKELAYLHPNYFSPDPLIFDELNINRGEKYVIIRFNAFAAVHDTGKHGFSEADKYTAIKALDKYARVFISAEGSLPKDLEAYRLPTPPHKIHQALYYAHLLICDTGTMTTESAILGTPSVTCLSNAARFSNYVELEHKYDLLYAFKQPADAIAKATELIQQRDVKEQWAQKRQRLLDDKNDVTHFMIDFIENYPDRVKEARKESGNRRRD